MRTVLLIALTLETATAAPPVFHVAPIGRDSWSGRLSAPNHARTDGPFATVGHAVEAARGSSGARIVLAGGAYELTGALVFTPANSGLTIEGAAKGRSVISGGVRLSGGKADGQGRWVFPVPPDLRSAEQLWVNGARRYRARLPKSGFFTIDRTLDPATGDLPNRFGFREGDLRPEWTDLNDVQILAFHQWTMQRMRIASVDATSRTVNLTGATWNRTMGGLEKGDRYIVENVREALSRPGEWRLDRAAGTLTYIPLPGETLTRAELVLPRLERIAELKGEAGRPVRNVTFRGITFAHTAYTTPPQGHSYPQAEMDLPATIRATYAERCRLEACAVSHTGGYAVDLGEGCRGDTLSGCRLTDLGGGGVRIGTMDLVAEPARAAGATVEDCLIAHGGRLHPAAVGVWIGQSAHNSIRYNEICDLYYTGVSVGWTWGYGESGARDNSVENNHIHDIGQALLSDMGGIYTLGVSPGSTLRGNVIHDVDSATYGGWGIYFDEGTTGMLAENNVVYRTKSAGFHQHYGKENVVRNNVFALGREHQVMRTRAEEHLSFTFESNLVYWTQGDLLGSNWEGSNFRLDRNLYWNAAGGAVTFAGQTLDQWKARGQDQHSIIADPLFRNPVRGDFRLKPGSPATGVGFQPIRTKAGPRKPLKDVPEAPGFPISAAE
ncbi:MAG TPA: right-handed parallel beta-helix repeat-containing protein [Armatimonadota bacterium]|jgi:hypothetical protein